MAGSDASVSQWPLSYRLQLPEPEQAPPRPAPQKQQWWSYNLYRGPLNEQPKVFYSKTMEGSETIAEEFLGEPVLGFDMEWPVRYGMAKAGPNQRIQDNIGVIQLACEDKIGLFHIGSHVGDSVEDIIAPSLRKIIESGNITKVGVKISADFKRLRDCCSIKARGVMELSHLHNLVVYGPTDPKQCTTATCALDKQVKTHFGLPLFKGHVRTSNWSQRNLTPEQKTYAASDAYAGFMLYHYLDSQRLAMEPMPPPPLHAEKYERFKIRGRGSMLLLRLGVDWDETDTEAVEVITALDFFEGRQEKTHTSDPNPAVEDESGVPATPPPPRRKTKAGAAAAPRPRWGRPLRTAPYRGQASKSSTEPKSLLQKLRDHRARVAAQRRCEPFMIAQNPVLEGIAKALPRTEMELVQIKGVGRKRKNSMGKAWLNIIDRHLQEEEEREAQNEEEEEEEKETGQSSESDAADEPAVEAVMPPTPPRTPARNRRNNDSVTPASRIPTLHTGLTSQTKRTRLEGSGTQAEPIALDDSEDDDPASGSPAASRSKPTSLKRKRTASTTTQHLDIFNADCYLQETGPSHGLYKFFQVERR